MFRKSSTLYILLLLFAVSNSVSVSAQQVSNPSGFYPVDSLLFTVNQAPPKGGKIQISVNCFTTAKCFSDYKGGVWLYNRNNTPNTWEDQQLSRAPTEAADTLAHRGKLDKVNVVRVRGINARGEVESDSVYFIGVTGVGASASPYSLPVVQLLVDSLDAFGPQGFYGPGEGIRNQYVHVWNYDIDESAIYNSYVPLARVEKASVIQVLGRGNRSLLYQKCGLHIAGVPPHSLPDKSMEVEARTAYSGTSTFNTTLLGENKTTYHSLRLLAGGGFAVHKVAADIATGINLGDVDATPVITFLNGSYWSLGYAEIDLEKDLPGDQGTGVSIFKPQYFERTAQFISKLHNLQIDSQNIAWTGIEGTNKTIGTGLLERGNKDQFLAVTKQLLSSVENKKPLSFADIDALVDLNSWLTYIAMVDFGRMKNAMQHHIFMCTAPGKKLFLLTDEISDFAGGSIGGNSWKEHILADGDDDGKKTFQSVLIRDVILKNKGCIEKLCLRYQDLLNTSFKPERTTAIVDKVENDFLPEYAKYYQAWSPNAGLDLASETKSLDALKSFCAGRPESAWQQLADQWMPESQLHLNQRKAVRVILDSVPQGTVKVLLNSLEITKSWDGLYYPKPDIEVSMLPVNVPDGMMLVWKEYPGKPSALKLTPLREITLTPVLRQAAKNSGN